MKCRHEIRKKTSYKVKKEKRGVFFYKVYGKIQLDEFYLFLLNQLTLIQFGSTYILQKFRNSTKVITK